MIYIFSHTPEIRYTLPVPHEIVRTDLTGLPDYWKDVRGMKALLAKKDEIEDEEIGNFQYRRYLDCFKIPEGYDCVGGKPFFNWFCPFDQYAQCHHLRDIAIVEDIVNDRWFSNWLHSIQLPSYDSMFIMKRDTWIECFTFVTDVLDTWDAHPDRSHDTGIQSYAPAFLAERLAGWWAERLKIFKANRIQLAR